jgi:enoyl-CoA hydratase
MESDHIIVRKSGVLGRLTLNRPEALNALTTEMCRTIARHLSAWERDNTVKAVLIDAVPGRAFCAGGDIRAVYEWSRAGDPRALEFFTVEYAMNRRIAHFPKPYIALLDGIVMGGGAGISVHGKYRVATEATLFAMPETAIGFFPDVGGTYFLPRCPGAIGMYLGLTSARINAADMLHAGLATHFVAQSSAAGIAPRLAEGEGPQLLLEALAGNAGTSSLAGLRNAIDRNFSAPSVEEILSRLTADGEWGAGTATLLRQSSPTSLKLAHRALLEGASLSLEECLDMELQISAEILRGHDFFEGVRAALIDKDQSPRWQPARLEEIGASQISRYFSGQ